MNFRNVFPILALAASSVWLGTTSCHDHGPLKPEKLKGASYLTSSQDNLAVITPKNDTLVIESRHSHHNATVSVSMDSTKDSLDVMLQNGRHYILASNNERDSRISYNANFPAFVRPFDNKKDTAIGFKLVD